MTPSLTPFNFTTDQLGENQSIRIIKSKVYVEDKSVREQQWFFSRLWTRSEYSQSAILQKVQEVAIGALNAHDFKTIEVIIPTYSMLIKRANLSKEESPIFEFISFLFCRILGGDIRSHENTLSQLERAPFNYCYKLDAKVTALKYLQPITTLDIEDFTKDSIKLLDSIRSFNGSLSDATSNRLTIDSASKALIAHIHGHFVEMFNIKLGSLIVPMDERRCSSPKEQHVLLKLRQAALDKEQATPLGELISLHSSLLLFKNELSEALFVLFYNWIKDTFLVKAEAEMANYQQLFKDADRIESIAVLESGVASFKLELQAASQKFDNARVAQLVAECDTLIADCQNGSLPNALKATALYNSVYKSFRNANVSLGSALMATKTLASEFFELEKIRNYQITPWSIGLIEFSQKHLVTCYQDAKTRLQKESQTVKLIQEKNRLPSTVVPWIYRGCLLAKEAFEKAFPFPQAAQSRAISC